MKPVYILIGIPGSGKSTQAKLLAQKFSLTHLDAGDTFESIVKHKTEPYWSEIEPSYTSGHPIPTKLFLEIISNKIKQPQFQNGFVFTQNTKSPEEIEQMLHMFYENGFELKKVIALITSRSVAIQRNLERKKNTNTFKDSDEETLIRRIDNYVKIFPSITEFYAQKKLLININADNAADVVFSELLTHVEELL